jgi:hypothetical protein
LFLSRVEADKYVLPVWWPPYWISDIRFHRSIYSMAPLSSWAQKPGSIVEISFLSRLEAEIKVFPVYRPPSWISDFRLHRS